MTTNKKSKSLFLYYIIFSICYLTLISCSGFDAEEPGTFSISIGTARAVTELPWDSTVPIANLTHKVTVKGGPGTQPAPVNLVYGGAPATITVEPGNWNIEVIAYDSASNEKAAGFRDNYQINSGPNPAVTVQMGAPIIVTFDSTGGNPATAKQVLGTGRTKATPPTNFTKGSNVIEGWYDNTGYTGSQFDFSNAISSSRTFYAKWAVATGGVTIAVQSIIDGAPAYTTPITISRSGAPPTFDVTITGTYTSISAKVINIDGTTETNIPETPSGSGTFQLDATNTSYNSLGLHSLIIEVTKNGIVYQANIPFTVVL